jgi:membrane AbrB-like protein
MVQSFRLLVLLTVLPSAIVLGGAGAGRAVAGEGALVASPLSFALTLGGGLALGLLLERLHVAAPILLGAAMVSTGLHATGAAPGDVPPLLATAGLVLIGVFVAGRFGSLDRAAFLRTIPAAAGSFAVGMTIAGLFAALAALMAGVGLADALVAFAPGGLEGMMVLGLVLGLDPLYVGVHHLVRFLGIGLALPLVMTWLGRSERRDDGGR